MGFMVVGTSCAPVTGTYMRVDYVVDVFWGQASSSETGGHVGERVHGLSCLNVFLDGECVSRYFFAEAQIKHDSGYFSSVSVLVLDEETQRRHSLSCVDRNRMDELVLGERKVTARQGMQSYCCQLLVTTICTCIGFHDCRL